MRRLLVLAAVLVALAVTPAAALAVTTPRFADGDGVHVTAVRQLSPRLFALTLTTPLLTAPTNVRVLLPEDYDNDPARRYPVLWLFHGTSGGAQDWTAEPGRAQDITAHLPLIVVMPDAGVDSNGGGWFTDWYNNGAYGTPQWETWHIDHLLPWIDTQLRTVGDRSGRAIAGLSQGGFGAMSYAARHPDLFVAAASFSGALDIAANGAQADPLIDPVLLATEVGLDGAAPGTFFGPRATNEINYAAHDPATLAGNLRGMHLWAYTGNGTPGPLDTGLPNPGAMAVEAGAHQLTALFHQELVARSIPIAYDDYGPGTHSWPYWVRDLRELAAPLLGVLGAHERPPATVDFQSDATSYDEWGWHVAIARPAREFSRLRAAAVAGFTLSGSGSATVTTPARYRPRSRLTVTLTGAAGSATRHVRADRGGRLTVAVPLGPGNPAQQETAGATTRVYTTRVRIRARRAR